MNFLLISFSPRCSKLIVTDTSSLSSISISALRKSKFSFAIFDRSLRSYKNTPESLSQSFEILFGTAKSIKNMGLFARFDSASCATFKLIISLAFESAKIAMSNLHSSAATLSKSIAAPCTSLDSALAFSQVLLDTVISCAPLAFRACATERPTSPEPASKILVSEIFSNMRVASSAATEPIVMFPLPTFVFVLIHFAQCMAFCKTIFNTLLQCDFSEASA